VGRRTEVVLACRVPAEVAQELREQARRHDRSISGELRCLLRAWREQSRQAGAVAE
jgi:hypothetical protein